MLRFIPFSEFYIVVEHNLLQKGEKRENKRAKEKEIVALTIRG